MSMTQQGYSSGAAGAAIVDKMQMPLPNTIFAAALSRADMAHSTVTKLEELADRLFPEPPDSKNAILKGITGGGEPAQLADSLDNLNARLLTVFTRLQSLG